MPRVGRVVAFPAILGVVLLSVGCAVAPLKSAAETTSDESLGANVYAALDADPIFLFRHVEVSVDDGVADLSGYVWSTEAIYRARRIARSVPGVRRVETGHLELQRDGFRSGRGR